MRIDIIPLAKILHHFFHYRVLALSHKLIVAAAGTHLLACGHENLHFRVRENGGSYIAAVHHYPSGSGCLVKLGIDEGAHVRDGRDRTDLSGHLHSAYFLFYAPVPDKGTVV